MLEILWTRLFSVSTWYYFAFFAISVTMFGLTAGAIAVFLWGHHFQEANLSKRMAGLAMVMGLAVDLALLTYLSIPFHPRLSGVGIFSTLLIYLAIAAPFFISGIIICLCLTRFPGKLNTLYGADLAGAALGAFLVFPVLNNLDGPTAVFLAGALAAAAGICFAKAAGSRLHYRRSATAFFLLTLVMMGNLFYRPVRVEWVKNRHSQPMEEAWNAFSRIAVVGFRWTEQPYNWGISNAYRAKEPIGEIEIDIDGVSGTVMTKNDGRLEALEHLKYDVTAIAHHVRKNTDVFVIGVGGGRDILTAKVFGQASVTGAEINDKILKFVNGEYGDFTGHLDRMPGVTVINDDARSVLAGTKKTFGIIQASCIATWSATSAGAFTLAENSLYTVEAWKIFWDRLNPDGILSFNRWYEPGYPAQLLRLAALAGATLKKEGVRNPQAHVAVIKSMGTRTQPPAGTILVSKRPFDKEDLRNLRAAAKKLEFEIVQEPELAKTELFRDMMANADNPAYYESLPLDLSPPTDNRPYFFQMLRLKDVFGNWRDRFVEQAFNFEAALMLVVLLGLSVLLGSALIAAPLLLRSKTTPLSFSEGWPPLVFFASIGFGYILIETAQLQRLVIFLGHPVYSTTVVLFALLLASGLGAMVWKKISVLPAIILVTLVALTIGVQPAALRSFEHMGVAARILAALGFLIPLGFVMGMLFPTGMKLALARWPAHAPWFWAINGAGSVIASVLSVCLAMGWGFDAAMKAGGLCYILAGAALHFMRKQPVPN